MPEHAAICPLCEASCGLRITTSGGRIDRITGDADDPFSQGHLCPKALALQDLDYFSEHVLILGSYPASGFRQGG